MNVAVGGTNGWFPDGPEKPWLDGANSTFLLLVVHRIDADVGVRLAAMSDFWTARNQWLPSWSLDDPASRSLVV